MNLFWLLMEFYLSSIHFETGCEQTYQLTDKPTDMTTYRAVIAAKIVIWKLSNIQ